MSYSPTKDELKEFFFEKYGDPKTTGWSPRRRFKFGYYSAGDRYEKTVEKLIQSGTAWVDVGGGHSLFPNNTDLSEILSSRCKRLVAVDPSHTVRDNPYCHDFVEDYFENYNSDEKFDIATLRMVAEHVADPDALTRKLNQVIKEDGLVIIYTINMYSPVPIVTKLLPFSFHYPIKKVLWGGNSEDTFPVAYKMNTRQQLSDIFSRHGFVEDHFERLDDLSVFTNYRIPNFFELLLWKTLNIVGLNYPEHNLLAVYKKVKSI